MDFLADMNMRPQYVAELEKHVNSLGFTQLKPCLEHYYSELRYSEYVVADILNVSGPTINYWLKKAKIPIQKSGGNIKSKWNRTKKRKY